MADTLRIKKIKLNDGSVYAIFDEGSLRLNDNNVLITGNDTVDNVIINGSLQITEIDDYKITIKHDKQQVKVPEKPKEKASEEFEPNYTNPFRKPDYAHSEDSVDDNSSSMSE